jgi:2-oxoglutarate ferredoxin oxidoreductase subunit beta
MLNMKDLETLAENTWCLGCGNFGILHAVKQAIIQLGLNQEELVAVTGIGCHGKITDYININGIHTIHGRVLPVATAIKLSNHELTVIGFSGDGDAFNIGMGHFPHAARRNIDLVYIIHNNLIYGLTTGQTSPTSLQGYISKTSPRGSFEIAINPLSQALTSNASFIARTYVGEMNHFIEILKQAIKHEGFAMIDVLQPCISWNRINSYDFYRNRVYKLENENHDPRNFKKAYEKTQEWGENIPIGVFYNEKRPTYRTSFPCLKETPLVKQSVSKNLLNNIIKEHY